MNQNIEVVFTFDTTGSMYPCLTQVRRTLKETVTKLFREIPNIRIGIIAHGDYCDEGSTYVTKILDFSQNPSEIVSFVDRVQATGGGDSPECYERVLFEARTKLSWTAGKHKVIALIGDDVPHEASYYGNKDKINWRNELGLLLESNINVYGVQALNRSHATHFYEEIALKTKGFHLNLDQFAHVVDMIMAVCYKQVSDEALSSFERQVKDAGRMNRSLDNIFGRLLNRKVSTEFREKNLESVSPGRFQILTVDHDMPIKQFAENEGLTFKPGRGFYEFTKASTIQDYKEVILMDRKSGDLFSGAKARELLGLPKSGTVRVSPEHLHKYIPFVQSTSYNRKLIGGTKFLYEVEDWDR